MANAPQNNAGSLHLSAQDRRGVLPARTADVHADTALPLPEHCGRCEERMASITFLAGQYKAGRTLIEVWARGVAVAAIGRASA